MSATSRPNDCSPDVSTDQMHRDLDITFERSCNVILMVWSFLSMATCISFSPGLPERGGCRILKRGGGPT